MSIVIHDYVRETAGKGGAKPATKPATKPHTTPAAKQHPTPAPKPEKKSILSNLLGNKKEAKVTHVEKKPTKTTTTTTTVVHTHEHEHEPGPEHTKGGVLKSVKNFVAKKLHAK